MAGPRKRMRYTDDLFSPQQRFPHGSRPGREYEYHHRTPSSSHMHSEDDFERSNKSSYNRQIPPISHSMTMERRRKRKRPHYTETSQASTTTGNTTTTGNPHSDNFGYHHSSISRSAITNTHTPHTHDTYTYTLHTHDTYTHTNTHHTSTQARPNESTSPYPPRSTCTSANQYSLKSVVETLPYPAEGVEVVYTKDAKDVDVWIKKNIIHGSVTAIGLDIEWKPQFVSKKKGGRENKTAVLQLATDNSCLVAHLYHMSLSSLPKSLVEVLADKSILKVGSGIKGDAIKLMHDTGLFCDGRADTQDYAKAIGVMQFEGLGLKNLAKRVLNVDLNKPKIVTMSNWEMYYLRSDQIYYAALDAWIGLKLFHRLKEQLSKMDRNEPEEELIETGEPVLKKMPIQVCQWCGKKCRGKAGSKKSLANHTCISITGHGPHMQESASMNPLSKKEVLEKPLEKELKSMLDFSCPFCWICCKGEAEFRQHIKAFKHASCKKCGKLFNAKVSKNHKKKVQQSQSIKLTQ